MDQYTQHKLTDPMLRRLSQIVNGRHTHHGNSLTALESRGLVTHKKGKNYRATDAGVKALEQARAEGW